MEILKKEINKKKKLFRKKIVEQQEHAQQGVPLPFDRGGK